MIKISFLTPKSPKGDFPVCVAPFRELKGKQRQMMGNILMRLLSRDDY
jgi:hypothetical protein